MKRPVRGLRRPPEPYYDVIVIGCGIGGLILALVVFYLVVGMFMLEPEFRPGNNAPPVALINLIAVLGTTLLFLLARRGKGLVPKGVPDIMNSRR